MNKFGFLVHPLNFDSFKSIIGKYSFVLNCLTRYNAKQVIKKLPVFRYAEVKNVMSDSGVVTDGVVYICPLLPEHFVTLPKSEVFKKIERVVRLARLSNIGILGLGGYTSIFTNQGLDLIGHPDIAVTTGNTFTANLVIQGILKACDLLRKKPDKCTLAIIGATGDIGSVCAKVFSGYFDRLILVARNVHKLEELALSMKNKCKAALVFKTDISEAIREADVIITATSSITTLIDYHDLKEKAILCDVSIPPNIARNISNFRKDVLVFEGGYAKMPNLSKVKNQKFKKHFKHNCIYGCLAETIILALEGKIENYSIGRGSIDRVKLDDINNIGLKHGFTLAPFFCGDKIIQSC